MNITKNEVSTTLNVLKINIGKEDYEPTIQKTLKEYQHKITLKGFRKGMVPVGLIRKMYGREILIEEINKVVIDSLYKYIYDNKIKTLGSPLPYKAEDLIIDWDNQTEFEFAFEIGISPEVDVSLTKNDNYTYYNILIDDKLVNVYVDSYAIRYGFYNPVDVSVEKELIKGDIVQLDKDGNILENGINSEDISFLLTSIKDQDIKNKFVGIKVGDKIIFNPRIAFPNITDLTLMLKLDKSKEALIENDFEFTVKDISIWTKSDINQELFDNIYGVGIVNSEEEFIEKIKEEITAHLKNESDYKFNLDCKEKIISDLNIELPEEFLKRLLLESENTGLTIEKIEEEYPIFEKDLKWKLIKDKIISGTGITATDEEIKEKVKKALEFQYRQYGLSQVPDEFLETYSKELLDKKEEKQKFVENIFEEKVYDFIKNSVNLDFKDISHDDFEKLF
jgi:trigger factor